MFGDARWTTELPGYRPPAAIPASSPGSAQWPFLHGARTWTVGARRRRGSAPDAQQFRPHAPYYAAETRACRHSRAGDALGSTVAISGSRTGLTPVAVLIFPALFNSTCLPITIPPSGDHSSLLF